METIIFVVNGELEEVNKHLEEGWIFKHIQCCSQNVSSWAYGYAGGSSSLQSNKHGSVSGDICAYIVLEKPTA